MQKRTLDCTKVRFYFFIIVKKSKALFFFCVWRILLCQFGKFLKLRAYIGVAAFAMWQKAVRAILYSAFYVFEVAAALVTEGVKRTEAKHTVEAFIFRFVTGKIYAFLVFVVIETVFHFICCLFIRFYLFSNISDRFEPFKDTFNHKKVRAFLISTQTRRVWSRLCNLPSTREGEPCGAARCGSVDALSFPTLR